VLPSGAGSVIGVSPAPVLPSVAGSMFGVSLAPVLLSGAGSVFGVSPAYRPVRKASLPPIQRGIEI
jgi:hypothetical protein